MHIQVKNTILMLFMSLACSLSAYAQKGEQLKHKEDRLMGQRVNGQMVNILVGNVEFTQPNTIINCDSAIFSPGGKNMRTPLMR